MKAVAAILRDAGDLIEPEGAWTRKELARNREGYSVHPDSPEAVCWCMMGAVAKVAPGGFKNDLFDLCTAAIIREVGESVTAFNDYGHNQKDVVSALRAAAEVEEAGR